MSLGSSQGDDQIKNQIWGISAKETSDLSRMLFLGFKSEYLCLIFVVDDVHVLFIFG
jgi:hypothetical protein